MSKVSRFLLDLFIACYSLIAIYYIAVLFIDFYHALLPPNDISFITENLFQFILIYGFVFGVHILLSAWMFADFSKRKFESNSSRAFWLGMLAAGFSPLYYFVHGRNSQK